MTQEEIVKALQPSPDHPIPLDTQQAISALQYKIEFLAARAERAEAELKEAISQMRGVHDHCAHCAFCECNTDDEQCCYCVNASNWKWRGIKKGGKDG